MKQLILLSIASLAILNGAAYKLPEQSISGTALSAANIASCDGADCAYYNSANISFLDNSIQYIEGGLTYVHLPKISYSGKNNLSGTWIDATAKTKSENIAIPYFHYVSKAYGPFRYALSLTVPGGLSKRWDTPVQKLYAKEFTLKTVQLNPSISYKVNSNFALSVGANIVYSEGKVYSDGRDVNLPIKREMEGDSIDYGYNLAATLHLNNGINIATTYRSKIKLSEEGKANLYLGSVGKKYNAYVNIYLPATLNIAISKKFNDLTLEFVYERTFWSSYKKLDFNYKPEISSALLKNAYDTTIDKLWRDTNSFRLGLKYRYNNKITLMAGYSYDETPIKEKHVSYELPDSQAHIFSAGFKYKHNSNLTWGVAALYDYKTKREVKNNLIDGTFNDGGALLITAGVEYKF
jgi:long-chain fatty acid transport protein